MFGVQPLDSHDAATARGCDPDAVYEAKLRLLAAMRHAGVRGSSYIVPPLWVSAVGALALWAVIFAAIVVM